MNNDIEETCGKRCCKETSVHADSDAKEACRKRGCEKAGAIMSVRIVQGNMTVGDVGAQVAITTDVTLTGKNIDILLIKPSGATLLTDTTVSGTVATYTSTSGQIDEEGEYTAMLKNVTDSYWFTGTVNWPVSPDPQDMAKAR